MNSKIYTVNLFVPLLVIMAIAAVSGFFNSRKKDSIKSELYDYFLNVWKTDGEETFYDKFLQLFVQAYEYEKYKEDTNKRKYHFYKMFVLLVVLCIPFLALFMITSKEWVLKDNEWNDIYLYTVILVPLIFSYLLNKYIRIGQYHETWYRHLRNRHYMEWRMMAFIKDFELNRTPGNKESAVSVESLKTAFINDMCDYWKSETDAIASSAGAKEENIFEDIGSLFGGKS